MIRNLSVILGAALCFGASPLQAQFNCITNGGAITIVGYSGSGGNVVIPGSINGYPVTGISSAFSMVSSITGVTIPSSVTNIGPHAFSDCAGLTSVDFGSGIVSIGDSAFHNCTQLGSIQLPDSLRYVGTNAFFYCQGMTNVQLGNGVTFLDYDAFSSCSSLKSIAIPASVTNVAAFALSMCLSMTNIAVDAANPNYVSCGGALLDKSLKTLCAVPGGLPGAYSVSNSVTSIGAASFAGCMGLSTISIPNGVTNIGDMAFVMCTALTNISIGSGVENIGSMAFYYCPSLLSVYCQGNAPVVGNNVFFLDTQATVYYWAGTTGWSSTLGGQPTVMLAAARPSIQTADSAFGIKSNRFGFNISWGTANASVVVETSTNLVDWSALSTNVLFNGTNFFSDPDWTNYSRRFYRLHAQ